MTPDFYNRSHNLIKVFLSLLPHLVSTVICVLHVFNFPFFEDCKFHYVLCFLSTHLLPAMSVFIG
jgi:multisubunit Na+/H+ antiporter MnhG subunit